MQGRSRHTGVMPSSLFPVPLPNIAGLSAVRGLVKKCCVDRAIQGICVKDRESMLCCVLFRVGFLSFQGFLLYCYVALKKGLQLLYTFGHSHFMNKDLAIQSLCEN